MNLRKIYKAYYLKVTAAYIYFICIYVYFFRLFGMCQKDNNGNKDLLTCIYWHFNTFLLELKYWKCIHFNQLIRYTKLANIFI